MRYLNKIVFINSANVGYAEVEIEGNVHFIGTQGVGKSTTLRAILFFYNADKLRLGIEKGKRTFDEYYLPHANSFIIYEVATEIGPFCVLAYRSQGRATFRFLDGRYNRSNFIDGHGHAMIWDQVRNTFSNPGAYSRKVDSYEEYRDILYGNNKGLPAQFRKFALIESRQYQNLPRTIQNVFLNSKLEAEFIKQTIIMSFNEEQVRIDLDQYGLHLQHFEQQLTDIGKWSEVNRSGEIIVRILADKIAKLYGEFYFIENEKRHLVAALVSGQNKLEKIRPGLLKRLETEQERLGQERGKIAQAVQRFQDTKEKTNKEITVFETKLSDARRKTAEYERLGIQSIIERVSQKGEWERKKEYLVEESRLLHARFTEITNKYDAMVQQLRNQSARITNEKQAQGNQLKEALFDFTQELNLQYEKLLEQIATENAVTKEDAQVLLTETKGKIHELELLRKENELKRWFEKEIENAKNTISAAEQTKSIAEAERISGKVRQDALQKQWELTVAQNESLCLSETDKLIVLINTAKQRISDHESLILNSKDSLYEWLHVNKPGWETTIGKVIDQKTVLFHPGLAPKLKTENDSLLFGIELDLSALPVEVKSIADYEDEIARLRTEISGYETGIQNISAQLETENEKVKKKYQPQIKELKELILSKEYEVSKAQSDRESAVLQRDEWINKGVSARAEAIEQIKQTIADAINAKDAAEESLRTLEQKIRRQLDDKKKERDQKLGAAKQRLQQQQQAIQQEIKHEQDRIEVRIREIESKSKSDLQDQGADIVRIEALEEEQRAVNTELDYIEANRDKVVEYQKDKRELFDHVAEFKAEKELRETRLLNAEQRHQAAYVKLVEAAELMEKTIVAQREKLREIDEDLQQFEEFSLTDVFQTLAGTTTKAREDMLDERLIHLIAQINERISAGVLRMNDLRSAINRFSGHFSAENIFNFKTVLLEEEEYLKFAENLREFLDENKIAEYEKRTNEQFASLIFQVGKETAELVSKEAEIAKVINDINRDFEERNFAGVIRSIQLRLRQSANPIVRLLQEIRLFNDQNALSLGKTNLFSNADTDSSNKKAVSYLKAFAIEIYRSKQSEITLSDSFELEFRIVENDNDSGWVEKLSNVGSEGTDVLVKAMINIMLLNVFKETASKKFKHFKLHCMMDEIGKLHPNNVKGILKFANDRNIMLVNSSPTSYNAVDYKHTYMLKKDSKHMTIIKRLVTTNVSYGIEQSIRN